MKLRALFFDLDDTLLETHTHSSDALDVVCRETAALHLGVSPAAVREVFLPTFADLEAEMERLEIVFADGDAMRAELWRRTLCNLALPSDDGERLGQRYQQERQERYHLFPDVEAHLPALRARYHLQLVTNGISDIQRGKIAASGLERWFSHITVSSEAGGWKPDAVVFEAALAKAGVTAEETVMIGDNPEKDIAGARALGMHTIWMRRWEWLGDRGVRADATATDMADLARILSTWAARE